MNSRCWKKLFSRVCLDGLEDLDSSVKSVVWCLLSVFDDDDWAQEFPYTVARYSDMHELLGVSDNEFLDALMKLRRAGWICVVQNSEGEDRICLSVPEYLDWSIDKQTGDPVNVFRRKVAGND